MYVVLSALCMSVFSSFYFYLDVFMIHIFPALGIFLDGSHWVMRCSPPGKFYYRLHRNVITLLPLSHEWNKRIYYYFFLACLNSLEPHLSDDKATSDQAAITFCQPGRIVKAAGKFCSDIRAAFKGFILVQGWFLYQNSMYDIHVWLSLKSCRKNQQCRKKRDLLSGSLKKTPKHQGKSFV